MSDVRVYIGRKDEAVVMVVVVVTGRAVCDAFVGDVFVEK
jgi:hypothetical protein